MKSYPDTSFLCALYVPQSSSPKAIAWMGRQKFAMALTSLLLFEFRQSAQFQIFRYQNDRTQGYPPKIASAALEALDSDIASGVFSIIPADWADVHQVADQLATQHTRKGGHRSFDILHVATAIHLGASKLLTFDSNQKQLAERAGLSVPW